MAGSVNEVTVPPYLTAVAVLSVPGEIGCRVWEEVSALAAKEEDRHERGRTEGDLLFVDAGNRVAALVKMRPLIQDETTYQVWLLVEVRPEDGADAIPDTVCDPVFHDGSAEDLQERLKEALPRVRPTMWRTWSGIPAMTSLDSRRPTSLPTFQTVCKS